MSNNISRQLATLRINERGQVAILMIIVLPVIFLFFALALDAGLWFLDHRIAQNQADAAVLAAAQHLPAADPGPGSPPTKAVHKWLKKNGSAPGQLESCPESIPPPDLVIAKGGLEYWDLHPASFPDGQYDTVRVCVRRSSPSIFAKLASLDGIFVSAGATARVGPAGIDKVMPWALAPQDPNCSTLCWNDLDGDNVYEPCGLQPPVPLGDSQGICPWGMDPDRLYAFKLSKIYTPGNFGAIGACGSGAQNYKDCIEGTTVSGFFKDDDLVFVQVETGNMGGVTNEALNNRYAKEAADGYKCDVKPTPNPDTGIDRDGKRRAEAMMVEGRRYTPAEIALYGEDPDFLAICASRLVGVPIIHHFPVGKKEVQVLGVATFAIAGWDRQATWGDAVGTDAKPCGKVGGKEPVFECGMVWGYFMEGVQLPHNLLNRISETDNPFAPNMIALVE